MKFMHLSDLHIGKRVNEYSMIDDQRYILKQILRTADEEQPDAILIAGDVYDKSMPSAEAVELLDEFLVTLAGQGKPVFLCSGNHDSPERLAFGNRLMAQSRVYISSVYRGETQRYTVADAYGEVDIYLLPFVKPAVVRAAFPDEEIQSYTDAVRVAIGHMELDPSRRSVLVAHQFVTGAERSESEELSVGGSDNVDSAVFAPFDYVALGHIHGPQNLAGGRIRYCGTPLKYSFSETKHRKSVSMVELDAPGAVTLREVPLTPLHDLVELRGSYNELVSKAFYDGTTWQEDYTHLTLTDEEDVPDAIARLRTVYHNLMRLDYDNARTRTNHTVTADECARRKQPLELFADFYELQNNQPMSEEQANYMRTLMQTIWEGEQ